MKGSWQHCCREGLFVARSWCVCSAPTSCLDDDAGEVSDSVADTLFGIVPSVSPLPIVVPAAVAMPQHPLARHSSSAEQLSLSGITASAVAELRTPSPLPSRAQTVRCTVFYLPIGSVD